MIICRKKSALNSWGVLQLSRILNVEISKKKYSIHRLSCPLMKNILLKKNLNLNNSMYHFMKNHITPLTFPSYT